MVDSLWAVSTTSSAHHTVQPFSGMCRKSLRHSTTGECCANAQNRSLMKERRHGNDNLLSSKTWQWQMERTPTSPVSQRSGLSGCLDVGLYRETRLRACRTFLPLRTGVGRNHHQGRFLLASKWQADRRKEDLIPFHSVCADTTCQPELNRSAIVDSCLRSYQYLTPLALDLLRNLKPTQPDHRELTHLRKVACRIAGNRQRFKASDFGGKGIDIPLDNVTR
jgi:hypothetical protein